MANVRLWRFVFSIVMAFNLAVSQSQIVLAAVPKDSTAGTLPFSQNWANTGLITASDDWNGVASIVGYRGDNLTAVTGADPQTILADDTPGVVDVNANQTLPDTYSSGGVTEFELTDPVVALNGSGTADAPYLLISLNTTGESNIQVAYNLRDLDGSTDDAIQPVALQYRVGSSGVFTNLASGYVADATTGPSLATLVTPVSVTLPVEAENKALVQLRIITANALNNDEWVGIDDISIQSIPADLAPTVSSTVPAGGTTNVAIDSTITVNFSEAVTVSAGWYSIACGNVPVAVTVSGGPETFTLTPNAVLPQGRYCTGVIDHTKVVDQDGTLDAMAENFSWSFNTVPANTLPSVVSTTPVNNAKYISPNSAITVVFSEAVGIGSTSFKCNGSNAGMSIFTSNQITYVFTPSSPLPLGASCTLTIPASQVKDATNQNMLADVVINFMVTACGAPTTLISSIQGTNDTSVGGPVTIQGFVTAKTADTNGFFVQSSLEAYDADPLTSEGLFIFSPNSDVTVGSYMYLAGTVSEVTAGGYSRMTEMGTTTYQEVCPSIGKTFPTYTDVDLSVGVTDNAFLERVESMLVNFTGTLTVQQNYFQGRYGQVTLAGGGRVFGPTNGGTSTDYLRMIVLDDWTTTQNASPIAYYDTEGALRAGDTAAGIKGVVNQGAINSTSTPAAFPYVYYRVQPTEAPVFTSANPRSATPPVVDGTIKVAAFNVENYFTTIDAGPYTYPYGTYSVGGTSVTNTPRGADSAAEFTRQKTKIIEGIKAMNADVYGLMEVEALNSAGALQDLVDTLNASIGSPTYAAIVDTVPDPDPVLYGLSGGYDFIQVALIYKVATVTPVGSAKVDLNPIFDRVPVAQTFEEIASGERFSVVVNHFKSKGSCPASGTDADQGDGQGCWNAKRVLQAEALLSFVNSELVPVDPDVLVIGDLNSYSQEDPIDALKLGGMVDQAEALIPASQRYSYVFDGSSGYLDHTLSTLSMVGQVVGGAYWHINADEPSVIDYNTEFKRYNGALTGSPDLYQPNVFRSSDHDPIMVGLALANKAPTLDKPLADLPATEDQLFTFTVPADTFSDPDAGDSLTYSAAKANGDPLPAWLSFDSSTRSFSGTPANGDVGVLSVKVIATDTSSADTSDVIDITIANVNDAPVVSNPLADQIVYSQRDVNLVLAADTFTDVDAGDTLTYTAELENGDPLPAWLSFDPVTQTFSGTPTINEFGEIVIKVTVTDASNETASFAFALEVRGLVFIPFLTQLP